MDVDLMNSRWLLDGQSDFPTVRLRFLRCHVQYTQRFHITTPFIYIHTVHHTPVMSLRPGTHSTRESPQTRKQPTGLLILSLRFLVPTRKTSHTVYTNISSHFLTLYLITFLTTFVQLYLPQPHLFHHPFLSFLA
jgi:hypothetical protein